MSKAGQAVLCVLLAAAPLASAQAVPAARGPAFYSAFSLPDVSGTVRFSLTVSDRYALGDNGSGTQGNSVNGSGNAAYLSRSPNHPFSAVYSGAYVHSTSGQPSEIASTLALSQVFGTQRWHFVVSEAINYLPETATSGLSGLPGLGDLNVPTVTTGSDQNQGILTNYAKQITNRVSGTANRQVTQRDSIFLTASQSITRYLDVPGGSTTDTNSYSLSSGLQHRLDGRTSLGVQYSYSDYSYTSYSFTSTSQSARINANRTLNRRTSIAGSIGPQWSSSSISAAIPSSTSLSATASLTYDATVAQFSLNYSRGTNNGNGLTPGAESNTLSASASKSFEQAVNLSAHIGYSENSSLIPGALSTKSLIFGAQANRSLLRHLSAYLSYSANRQLLDGNAISSVAFNGFQQSLAFGVTYAPAAINVGHH